MSLLFLENICFKILNFSGFQSHANCRLYLLVIHPDFRAVPYRLTQNQQTLSLAERPTDTMRLDRGFSNNYTVQLMHSVVSIMVSFNQPALLN